MLDTLTSANVVRYLEVYIDWNRDCDFTEGNEKVIDQSITAAAGKRAFSFSITVPANAVLGNTRMRVILRTVNHPSSCSNTTLGEIEDYQGQYFILFRKRVMPESHYTHILHSRFLRECKPL